MLKYLNNFVRNNSLLHSKHKLCRNSFLRNIAANILEPDLGHIPNIIFNVRLYHHVYGITFPQPLHLLQTPIYPPNQSIPQNVGGLSVAE